MLGWWWQTQRLYKYERFKFDIITTKAMAVKLTFSFLTLLLILSLTASRKHNNRNNVANIINSKTNLELVHVVFRHGDRTPERRYPNDIYTEADFYPIGFSQLTNAGKLRAYQIGTTLRTTFNKFLGDIFYPDIIDSISSHSPRCKTSLLAVLAGLFPPKTSQIWNSDLVWQPISFNAYTSSENRVFAPFGSCPSYTNLVAQAMEAIYQDSNFTQFEDKFDYILTNAGMTGNIGYAVDLLYSTLKSEQEFGLPLPNWTSAVWPEPISSMQSHGFKYLALNDNLKSIAAGYLTKKIVDNTYLTINNKAPVGRKIYLYSGHDANIVSLLMMMDNFEPHCPSYGAYITFEVHHIDEERYFKITYENYSSTTPQTLTLPCGSYCTVAEFVNLYSKYLNTTATDALCGSW